MYPKFIKQPSIRGIAGGAKANGEIPTTGTHHGLLLQCKTAAGVLLTTAEIKADLGDIIIRLNGKQKIEASATFLLDLQKYYGDADGADNVSGQIFIPFSRRLLRSFEEQSLYAWGMKDIRSFTIDVQCAAVLAKLASIEVFSLVSPEERVLGKHYTIRRFAQTFAGTGIFEVSTLPREDGNVAYLSLHQEDGAGTFEKVTIKVNNDPIFEEVSPESAQILCENSGRTPQTGYFHVPFDKNNHLSGFLPMNGIKDFRVQNYFSVAPGAHNIYAEMLEGLGA